MRNLDQLQGTIADVVLHVELEETPTHLAVTVREFTEENMAEKKSSIRYADSPASYKSRSIGEQDFVSTLSILLQSILNHEQQINLKQDLRTLSGIFERIRQGRAIPNSLREFYELKRPALELPALETMDPDQAQHVHHKLTSQEVLLPGKYVYIPRIDFFSDFSKDGRALFTARGNYFTRHRDTLREELKTYLKGPRN